VRRRDPEERDVERDIAPDTFLHCSELTEFIYIEPYVFEAADRVQCC
jgi:hypothetical protein